MANSWVADDFKLNAVSALLNPSAEVVSKEFSITAGGAVNGMRIDIVVDTVNVAGAIFRLQHKSSDDGGWTTVKSTAAVSAAGEVSILIHEQVDSASMPLKHLGRIIADGGAGDLVLGRIRVIQPK